jgi:hypothetical protein
MAASVRTEVATAIPTFQVPSAAFFKFFPSHAFALAPKGSSLLSGFSDATIFANSSASSLVIPASTSVLAKPLVSP